MAEIYYTWYDIANLRLRVRVRRLGEKKDDNTYEISWQQKIERKRGKVYTYVATDTHFSPHFLPRLPREPPPVTTAAGHAAPIHRRRRGEEADDASRMHIMLDDDDGPEIVLCALRWYPGRLEMTPGFSEYDKDALLAKLRRITYRVAANHVYEYTIENASWKPEDDDVLKEMLAIEARADEAKVVELRRRAADKAEKLVVPPHPRPGIALVLVISEVTGFVDCDDLYVDYAVDLPRGWRAADEALLKGRTRLSRRPLDADASAAALAGVGLIFLFGLLAGPSYALWLAAAVLAVASRGAWPRADEPLPLDKTIDLFLYKEDDDDDVPPPPTAHFQFVSRRSFGRSVVEGYTYWRLKTDEHKTPHRAALRAWRPDGGLSATCFDFFLGGANRLLDARFASSHQDKSHFVSVTAGTLFVSLTVEPYEPPPKPQDHPHQPPPPKSRGRETIDRILNNLKIKLQDDERKFQFDPDKSRSARERAAELIKNLQMQREGLHTMGSFVPPRDLDIEEDSDDDDDDDPKKHDDDLFGVPETKGTGPYDDDDDDDDVKRRTS
ncbi:hypothetical protein CTAYLR_009474 [Chrysophaeum taylorii]|uniref:Uncharacterized protein n=1 Tax=Chrysophaeum taylorii TaxID=2483200 RepID=A0AAD7UKZ6_9STRA|nr:hypothetical protein CTAYLR_009474 [Chrysophaeum taylorii]